MPPLPPPNTAYPQHQQQPTYFNTVLNNTNSPSHNSGSAGIGAQHAPPSPHTAPAPASASGGTITAGSPSQAARYRMDREREREREREEKEDEEMRRSLQARGKDYNVGGKRRSMGNGKEYDWEQRQQRDEAATILESEEMLLWIAASRNESVPQTRAHYRNILLGLSHHEAANVAWNDEWEVPQQRDGVQGPALGSPGRSSGGRGKEKERDIARMRKRVSSGQGV